VCHHRQGLPEPDWPGPTVSNSKPLGGHTLLYYRNHHRVNRVRGPASQRTCERCGGAAQDWATVKGFNSELDRVDPLTGFLPLCKKCHRVYDEVEWTWWIGRHHSDETKEKLRQAKLGKSNHTPESRRKISEAMKGREFSAETRERMRQAQLGKTQSAEARDNMSAAQKRRYGLAPGERASHGSTGYRKGCRCDECRAGHAAAEAARKARRAAEGRS
jgi:hypothetical protein